MKKIKIMMMALMMCFVNVSFGQDTLKYNSLSEKPEQWYFDVYQSKDGTCYKVGDKINILTPSSNKTFAFIYQGDGISMPMTNAPINLSGLSVEIKKISYGGTRRVGFQTVFVCKGVVGWGDGIRIMFENALNSNEIKGFGITSDEALAELKKSKEKLELGLITQEEFNNKKSELSKYIK
jgi:hypothetical protein